MHLKPEQREAMLAAVTDEWKTAKEIARDSKVAFQRVTFELVSEAKKGIILDEYQKRGHRNTLVAVYKCKPQQNLLTASQ